MYKRQTYKKALQTEHAIAELCSEQVKNKWKFNLSLAKKHYEYLTFEMKKIEDKVNPTLKPRKVFIDKEPKTPKFKKNGEYTTTTIRMLREYFDKEVMAWDTHMMPPGHTFQRFRVEDITLGSMDLVKDWLITKGWVPDEYQKKKVGFQWVTTGPKLTSTSLRKMGNIGEMIDDYYTLRNRRSVLSGWLDGLRNNRLHGNMWTIGTPTFRARHEVIVNLPAVSAAWGKELRAVSYTHLTLPTNREV